MHKVPDDISTCHPYFVASCFPSFVLYPSFWTAVRSERCRRYNWSNWPPCPLVAWELQLEDRNPYRHSGWAHRPQSVWHSSSPGGPLRLGIQVRVTQLGNSKDSEVPKSLNALAADSGYWALGLTGPWIGIFLSQGDSGSHGDSGNSKFCVTVTQEIPSQAGPGQPSGSVARVWVDSGQGTDLILNFRVLRIAKLSPA